MAYEDQKPRLAPDLEPARVVSTPAEGFLLSRIDGNTAWGQLRQIGGMPPEDVERCLTRWLAEGVLTVNGAPARAPGEPAASDLTPEEQGRVAELEALLDRPYHEILGVERGADAKTIKRAYFALSKEFHPDRHFRRKLGDDGARIERIFRKVVEAYELLSDPATRAEIERSLAVQAPPAATAPEAAEQEESEASRPRPQPTLTPRRAALERLRSHFRIPEKVLTERKFKAKQFQQAAMVGARRGNWMEAASAIRLAIAFDPWSDEYKHAFAEIQAQVHQLRAADLLREAEASLDSRAQHDALRMYEEALAYRPCDPEINTRAARLALEVAELDKALEYAETACETDPESADAHAVHGRALWRSGVREKAKKELDRALAIDPDHEEAKAQIASMKRRQSESSRRGSRR